MDVSGPEFKVLERCDVLSPCRKGKPLGEQRPGHKGRARGPSHLLPQRGKSPTLNRHFAAVENASVTIHILPYSSSQTEVMPIPTPLHAEGQDRPAITPPLLLISKRQRHIFTTKCTAPHPLHLFIPWISSDLSDPRLER